MLSRVKVRSVTSPAAIPDLAQQIMGKCRLIHSSKVCQSTALWHQLCCSLPPPARLHPMLLQVPQVEALLHELLQRDSGSPGMQGKPGQFAIAYSECHCSTSLPSQHACSRQSWDDAALLLAWAPELFAVMALCPSPCAGNAVTGQVWTTSSWHLQAAPTSSSCGSGTRNALRARSSQSLSSQPCWSTWIHTL